MPRWMQLAAAGAAPFDDLESLVGSVDAVIAMLWDDRVAREISLGRIIPAAREGQLVIESTTLSPQMYETLAEAAAKRGRGVSRMPRHRERRRRARRNAEALSGGPHGGLRACP